MSYTWNPVVGGFLRWDYLSGTTTNWFDNSTGLQATSLPTSTTDVSFVGSTSNQKCIINTTANCNSLAVYSDYTNILDLSYGTLNVYNSGTINISSVLSTSSSTSDTLQVSSQNGTLNVLAGTFDYEGYSLNLTGSNVTPIPRSLFINVTGSGTFIVNSPCKIMGANLQAGGTTSGTIEFSTVTAGFGYYFTALGVASAIERGTILFDDYAEESSANISITNGGKLTIGNGAEISLADDLQLDNSTLITNNSTTNSTGTINGVLRLVNGSQLKMSSYDGKYYNLTISTALIFQDSSFYYDVKGASGSSGDDTCDKITTVGINILGLSASYCYTYGTPTAGKHDYYPMTTFGPPQGGIQGHFSQYNWLGTGFKWIYEYKNFGAAPDGFHLLESAARAIKWVGGDATNPTLWEIADNWFDVSTQDLATTPPDENTDCYFEDDSPTTCDLYLPQNSCQTINVSPGWGGAINLHGASLNVYGVNSSDGGYSTINSGVIQLVADMDGNYPMDDSSKSLDYNPSGVSSVPGMDNGSIGMSDPSTAFSINAPIVNIIGGNFNYNGTSLGVQT